MSGSATDDGLPAGSTLTYTWSVTGGPSAPDGSAGATFANVKAAQTTARFPGGAGTYTLTLTASDGQLTGSASTQVTVSPYLYPSAANWSAANTTGCGGAATGWQQAAKPEDMGLSSSQLQAAMQFAQSQQQRYTSPGYPLNEAAYVIRYGYLAYCWADGQQTSGQTPPGQPAGQPATDFTRYSMFSTTKSMGGLALLLAIGDGKLSPDLSNNVSAVLASSPMVFGTDPSIDTSPVPNGASELSSVTVFQLATHTSGLSKSDNAPTSTRQLIYAPGTTWSYSDQGLNWLADVLTWVYQGDLWQSVMIPRIYQPLGIGKNDLTWRANVYRTPQITLTNGSNVDRRELAAGITTTVNAMARVGLLMLRKGAWSGQQLVSSAAVDEVTKPPAQNASLTIADPTNYLGATTNYGILWWTNAGGLMPKVPTDTYFAWGLDETLIVVIPSLDLIIARAGNYAWNPKDGTINYWDGDYTRIEQFIQDIVAAVQQQP